LYGYVRKVQILEKQYPAFAEDQDGPRPERHRGGARALEHHLHPGVPADVQLRVRDDRGGHQQHQRGPAPGERDRQLQPPDPHRHRRRIPELPSGLRPEEVRLLLRLPPLLLHREADDAYHGLGPVLFFRLYAYVPGTRASPSVGLHRLPDLVFRAAAAVLQPPPVGHRPAEPGHVRRPPAEFARFRPGFLPEYRPGLRGGVRGRDPGPPAHVLHHHLLRGPAGQDAQGPGRLPVHRTEVRERLRRGRPTRGTQ